ncbi:MAG TPA: response regulator transcription factor [Terriglobia bacterium]|nr:response regulator transcription factor [Terriglobia bacterium]
MRILLADQQSHFRRFLRRVLEKDPALEVVAEAMDGEQAVQLAESLQPEIVMMSIELPGLDGLEAARRVKERLREAKVVLLSALGDEAHERAAFEGGADAFLPKSTPVAEIVNVLHGIGKPSQGQRPDSV